MRYGVIADIHANLHALRAAIARLRRDGVDAWLCAGDVVGYGPHPNECVETVAELGAVCVAGNHELLVERRLDERSAGRLARETIGWTRAVLRDDCRAYLAALPLVATAPGIVMTHGSLQGPDEYVRREEDAARQLGLLARDHPDARVLIVGHTHEPWVHGERSGTLARGPAGAVALPPGDRYLLNPGAVGQSRERAKPPRALCMTLDLEPARVRLLWERYDVRACRAALRRHRLAVDAIHIHPGALATARRRGRRALRWSLRRSPRP
jgi:predicted phosphodiesterase